jgi:hypothetical protein
MAINPKVTNNAKDADAKVSNHEDLLIVEVERNPKTGLQLHVKSPKDWSLFRSNDGKLSNVGGVACYVPRNERVEGIGASFARTTGYDILYYQGLPNLVILLAKDLNEGVTFNLGMFPIAEEVIKRWGEQLKEQVKSLYLTYCKPFKYRIEFTTVTVEVEQHD